MAYHANSSGRRYDSFCAGDARAYNFSKPSSNTKPYATRDTCSRDIVGETDPESRMYRGYDDRYYHQRRSLSPSEPSRYSRRTRRSWPPSPSVEDEPLSLSKEFGAVILSDGDEACNRGDIDQDPIMVEVEHVRKKSRDDWTPVWISGGEKDERGRPRRPSVRTDFDAPEMQRRERTPYAYRPSKSQIERTSGEFFLSPDTITPASAGSSMSRKDARRPRSSHDAAPAQTESYRKLNKYASTANLSPEKSRSRRPTVGSDSDRDADEAASRGLRRKPSLYSFNSRELKQKEQNEPTRKPSEPVPEIPRAVRQPTIDSDIDPRNYQPHRRIDSMNVVYPQGSVRPPPLPQRGTWSNQDTYSRAEEANPPRTSRSRRSSPQRTASEYSGTSRETKPLGQSQPSRATSGYPIPIPEPVSRTQSKYSRHSGESLKIDTSSNESSSSSSNQASPRASSRRPERKLSKMSLGEYEEKDRYRDSSRHRSNNRASSHHRGHREHREHRSDRSDRSDREQRESRDPREQQTLRPKRSGHLSLDPRDSQARNLHQRSISDFRRHPDMVEAVPPVPPLPYPVDNTMMPAESVFQYQHPIPPSYIPQAPPSPLKTPKQVDYLQRPPTHTRHLSFGPERPDRPYRSDLYSSPTTPTSRNMNQYTPTTPTTQEATPLSPSYRAARLPPCPRWEYTSRHSDWSTIISLPDFCDICPHCLAAILELNPEYRLQFLRAPPRPAGSKIRCDFADPWFRLAWVLTVQRRLPDLRLLHSLAMIRASEMPCPSDHSPISPTLSSSSESWDVFNIGKSWYALDTNSSSLRRRVDPDADFLVCAKDKKYLEALMPSLGSAFSKMYSASGKRKRCKMGVNERGWSELTDMLVNVDDAVRQGRRMDW